MKGKTLADTNWKWALFFCIPNILYFLIFFVIAAFIGLGYSFTDFNGMKRMNFVGIANYVKLFKDPEFYYVLWNTTKYTVFSVLLGYIVALALALFLASENLRGSSVYRVLIYWPTLLSTIMVGLTWKWIFGENFGVINYMITKMGLPGVHWSTSPSAAFLTTVIAGLWSGCGTNMLIFIGGIKQIPAEYHEAAVIDGAGTLQELLHITLPALSPVSFMVIVLSVITNFKVFAMVQTLTNGGPGNATTYMIQYIYTTGFDKMQVGYSCAASIVLFVILVVCSSVQMGVNNSQTR